VAGRSGPFAGLDVGAPVIDVPPSQTLVFQAEKASDMTGTGNGGVAGSEFGLYGTTALLSTTNPVHFPVTDQYDIVVRARSSPGVGAIAEVHIGGPVAASFTPNPATLANHTSTVTVTAGDRVLQIGFPNDRNDASGKDINLYVDSVTVTGPKSASTGTARETAARAGIDQLYRKMLYRRPTAAESDA